jgi:hypothetical protein
LQNPGYQNETNHVVKPSRTRFPRFPASECFVVPVIVVIGFHAGFKVDSSQTADLPIFCTNSRDLESEGIGVKKADHVVRFEQSELV